MKRILKIILAILLFPLFLALLIILAILLFPLFLVLLIILAITMRDIKDSWEDYAFCCFDYYKQRINDLETFIRKSKCSPTCECEKCRDIAKILQELL